jgi:alpha-mannosidase
VVHSTVGYSSQLPQIARLAGTKNFYTNKLSWNSVNPWPHSSFNWVGLDGSQSLTHMTPVNNYNSQCNMDDLRNGVTNHKNLEVTSQALLLFGNGDGGGGPTPPMMEKLRRARAIGLNKDCGRSDLPLVRMGGGIDEFFDSLREETDGGSKLPNWRGELYFEFHRGTYTSHGSIKRNNRKLEILLREIEYIGTMASISNKSYAYPKAGLDRAWEDLLLCQFHDVLPGSGIAMIYEDAEAKYKGIRERGAQMLEDAHQALLAGSQALTGPAAKVASSSKGQIIAFNTIPDYRRCEVVPISLLEQPKLKALSAQVSSDKQTGYMLVDATGPEPIGTVKGLFADVQPVKVMQLEPGVFTLGNSSVVMKMAHGRITSLFDVKLERELIPAHQTGGFIIFEDHPNSFDAWEIEAFHLEKFERLRFSDVTIVDDGPLRGTLLCEVVQGSSRISVKISLDALAASVETEARSLIRFDCMVDWREKHHFLKFELPVDIHDNDATFECQFGSLKRPTHRNTSWDQAKFEVCGHKFADLSEYGYGVAILNDCKYGYAVEGNVMRLSLLRAPTQPDPECDMGTHEFAFAIYPHVGTYAESDVAKVAYAFNNPMHRESLRSSSILRKNPDGHTRTVRYMEQPLIPALAMAKTPRFSLEDAPNVMLETVKRGEDDELVKGTKETVVLRMFEQFGGHAKAKLRM